MPVNVDSETGIAFGVLSASTVPYLCEHIIEKGKDLAFERSVNKMMTSLQSVFCDFDAEDMADAKPDPVTAARQWFRSNLIHAGLPGKLADHVVDEITGLMDKESLTFDIDECVDAAMVEIRASDYFNGNDDVVSYRLEEDGYVYSYDGELVWVLKSHYGVPCRTCSPCCMNAGDLGTVADADAANNFAYCPPPKWWCEKFDAADRPPAVFLLRHNGTRELVWPAPPGTATEPLPVLRLEWTVDDSKAALKRGWDLFTGDRFEICKYDEDSPFQTDDHAVMAVIKSALQGDVLAIKAIIIAGVVDPQSLAADFSGLRDVKALVCVDANGKVQGGMSTIECRRIS